jgi:hypothetical protein
MNGHMSPPMPSAGQPGQMFPQNPLSQQRVAYNPPRAMPPQPQRRPSRLSGQFGDADKYVAAGPQDHTPQMAPQPPPQIFAMPPQPMPLGMAQVTPLMPNQQQPTPQSQPRPLAAEPLPNGSRGGSAPHSAPMPSAGTPAGTPAGVHAPQPGLAQAQAMAAQAQAQAQAQAAAQAAAAAAGTGTARPDPNDLNAKIFRKNLGNAATVRVLDMVEQISSESQSLSLLESWQRIMGVFFTPGCTLRFTNSTLAGIAVAAAAATDAALAVAAPTATGAAAAQARANDVNYAGTTTQFELSATTAPRFFLANVVDNRVARFQVSLPGLRSQIFANGAIYIGGRLAMQIDYRDGLRATVGGVCKFLMNRDFKIEWCNCQCTEYEAVLPMGALETRWREYAAGGGAATSEPNFYKHVRTHVAAAQNAATCGLDHGAVRMLNIGDVMAQLRALMAFLLASNIALPLRALEQYMLPSAGQQQQLMMQHRHQQQQMQQMHLQQQQQQQQQHQQQQIQQHQHQHHLQQQLQQHHHQQHHHQQLKHHPSMVNNWVSANPAEPPASASPSPDDKKKRRVSASAASPALKGRRR